MVTYEQFCAHRALDPAAPASRALYKESVFADRYGDSLAGQVTEPVTARDYADRLVKDLAAAYSSLQSPLPETGRYRADGGPAGMTQAERRYVSLKCPKCSGTWPAGDVARLAYCRLEVRDLGGRYHGRCPDPACGHDGRFLWRAGQGCGMDLLLSLHDADQPDPDELRRLGLTVTVVHDAVEVSGTEVQVAGAVRMGLLSSAFHRGLPAPVAEGPAATVYSSGSALIEVDFPPGGGPGEVLSFTPEADAPIVLERKES